MVFKKVYIAALVITCFAMVSSMPTDTNQKEKRQGQILGNPAQVFTGLFKDLSKVAIGKIDSIGNGMSNKFPSMPSPIPTADDIKSFKYKRLDNDYESDEDVSDMDEVKIDTDVKKRSDDEITLENLDAKLKELQLKIKENFNEEGYADKKEYQEAKERFANEFKDLKANFLKNMEGIATGLAEFRDKFLGEVNVEKKSNRGCYHGEDCMYDLDVLDEMEQIDARIKSFDESIKSTLKLPIFDHNRFQRTKIQFTKQYKDSKEMFLNRMHKIASVIANFAEKAQSSNQADKKFVNRKEEGLLYRNDQSLF